MNKLDDKMKKITLFLTLFILLSSISLAETSQLKVTPEHPFYLNGKWVEASELKPGDKLKTIDGKTAVIKNIQKVKTEKPITVYNLEDDFYLHNYVVGDGLVVHNSQKAAMTSQEILEIDWGHTSEKYFGKPGEVEWIIIDDIDSKDAARIRFYYKQIFDNPRISIERKVEKFSLEMARELPFMGKNSEYYAWNGDELAPALEKYLSLFKTGPKKLSFLFRHKKLACNSQHLAIKQALGPERRWELYHDVTPDGRQRVHSILAKKIGLDALIMDSTELQGKFNHGWTMPWKDFVRKFKPVKTVQCLGPRLSGSPGTP